VEEKEELSTHAAGKKKTPMLTTPIVPGGSAPLTTEGGGRKSLPYRGKEKGTPEFLLGVGVLEEKKP